MPLIVVVLLAGVAYYALGRGGLSLEALVRHRTAIGGFVTEHRVLAVLAYIGLYIAAVALSVPGAVFLTVSGGLLFGVGVGGSAAVIGATIGATLIFLVARTALGEPLLRRAGPRAAQVGAGFPRRRLQLSVVPAAGAGLSVLSGQPGSGLRRRPARAFCLAATALGVIPASFVYAFAGTGLDSVISAQKDSFQDCLAAGRADCHLTFDPRDILTPELLGALVALGLLALVPVVVRRLRARRSASL